MKRSLMIWLIAGAAVFADEPVRIKLGTLMPKESSPHQTLKAMAETWSKNGAVVAVLCGLLPTHVGDQGDARACRDLPIGMLPNAASDDPAIFEAHDRHALHLAVFAHTAGAGAPRVSLRQDD